MKYSFVKDFPGIGACDAYIGAVVSGKKEEKKGCVVGELLAAVDEKCFSGKEGQLFSANLFHEGKLVTCVLAGLGEKATSKSVEAAFAGAVKEAKKQKPGTVGILVHPDFADKCVEAVLLAVLTRINQKKQTKFPMFSMAWRNRRPKKGSYWERPCGIPAAWSTSRPTS